MIFLPIALSLFFPVHLHFFHQWAILSGIIYMFLFWAGIYPINFAKSNESGEEEEKSANDSSVHSTREPSHSGGYIK